MNKNTGGPPNGDGDRPEENWRISAMKSSSPRKRANPKQGDETGRPAKRRAQRERLLAVLNEVLQIIEEDEDFR